jgi:hypothetical protein
MTGEPSMGNLWQEAGGDRERYRALLHEHGLLLRPGDDGYEEAVARALPCGWSPGMERALDSIDQGAARRARMSQASAGWCIHDLPPGTCSMCTGRGEEIPGKPDPSRRGPWFFGRYPGKCAGCGEQWPAGEEIRADGDGGVPVPELRE